MTSINKVVHINFKEEEHVNLRERAASLGMPIATYAKAVILDYLSGVDRFQSIPGNSRPKPKIRTIKNAR